MSHAWLDSLSEDWVSQPPSESTPPPPLLSQHVNRDIPASPGQKSNASRIPRLNLDRNKSNSLLSDGGSNVLSERSINEVALPVSKRAPSKLSREVEADENGRTPSRSASVTTSASSHSVVQNTVNHKSQGRDGAQTPEWKRRLVQGGLEYGAQRDLFTSAGAGLENIFRPPQPPVPSDSPGPMDRQDQASLSHDATLPSSPPVFHRNLSSIEIQVDGSTLEEDLTGLPQRPAPTATACQGSDNSAVSFSYGDQSVPSRHGDPNPYLCGARDGGDGESSLGRTAPTALHNPGLRAISGQTDLNEDFSPILLSCHNDDDGKTTYTPVEVPAGELRRRLESLRRNQSCLAAHLDGSRDNVDVAQVRDDCPHRDDSEGLAHLGAFVNLRRGGRSADGSFCDRLLSSGLNESSELPDESLQASTPKRFPTFGLPGPRRAREGSWSPQVPAAPHPSPEKPREQFQSSTGSPLKLFQPYDTFTNQTLLRRLSQFEDHTSDESLPAVQPPAEQNVLHGSYDPEEVAAAHEARRRDSMAFRSKPSGEHATAVNKFGAGDLDTYEFNEDLSYNSNQDSTLEDSFVLGEQPNGATIQGPRERIFDVPREASLVDEGPLAAQPRRQISVAQSSPRRPAHLRSNPIARVALSQPLNTHNVGDMLSTPRPLEAAAEGKRPRTTPAKDPTPKRRRTLHKSDIAYAADDPATVLDTVQLSHQQMQSVIGKKRKDARHGDAQQLANPLVLANRRVLRPRTPTPSQKLSMQHQSILLSHHDNHVPPSPPFSPSQGAVTPDAAGVEASLDTDRKPSIKTEDFINEANKIMAMIRSKAGLRSGLASVEESDLEDSQQYSGLEQEDSFAGSTSEPFSRPPSREGRPLLRVAARQEDPEIALRLKKYEEGSEMGDIIGSSIRSLGLAQDAIRSARGAHQQAQGTPAGGTAQSQAQDSGVISDPPNIRLSHNPDPPLPGHSPLGGLREAEFPSIRSRTSSDCSTSRSIPTGSSRGSDSRKVIAPESVEHLIPDQVGNMILDRRRNIWIKRKQGGSSKSKMLLPSEASEEDPFAGIPDLSVDTLVELQNLRLAASAEDQEQIAEFQSETQTPASSGWMQDPPSELLSPSISPSAKRSPAPAPVVGPTEFVEASASQPNGASGPGDEGIEREISIHEDRTGTPKRKHLTITFSSPIASIIQDVVDDMDGSSLHDQSAADSSLSSTKRGRRAVSSQPKPKGAVSRSRSNSRPASRQISVGGHPFFPRPVSRIDEQDEDADINRQDASQCRSNSLEVSLIGDRSVADSADDQAQNNLNFVVTPPARSRNCPVADAEAAPIISQYVGTLSLSPLSEFTVHHSDQSLPLEVSYVVDDHHLVTGARERKVLSMNTRDLVQKLAEVEPFEPYWEDMRELDVCEKQLESLHSLDKFCDRLETLDASNNQIRNLVGVPSSVRQLKVTHNLLSGLTAWGHLTNLQYVDVSDNGLTSLAPFKNLVHLRGLRADNNQLTSLDGVKFHDGLQVLRLRGNAIEAVDFDGTRLCRLTELDLRGNKIRRLANLEQVSSLSSLDLDDNQLDDLGVDPQAPCGALRYLNLNGNNLREIDLRGVPGVRLLHADRNRLRQLSGFSKARRLDSLSLREQRCEEALDLSFLTRAYEVRKLYLSGNRLENLDPQVDFLNLQLLELSNCGLQSLPPYLGQMMPNLRVVNLNFNAISNLGPLRFIPRLKRVLVAGNRLSDSASVISGLAEFPQLTQADLRDNPMTQGFYPPLQVLLRKGDLNTIDPFTLPDGDPERDSTYSSRLDLETRMRRRLYEQVFASSCGKLRMLDGLPLRRDIDQLRDAVWVALATQGLILSKDGKRFNVSEGNGDGDQSRWGAENSFA